MKNKMTNFNIYVDLIFIWKIFIQYLRFNGIIVCETIRL